MRPSAQVILCALLALGGCDGRDRVDAGRADGGASDAGAPARDGGPGMDGGAPDAGGSDAGGSDAGGSDAGGSDAGGSDAGPPVELCGVAGDEDGDGRADCADEDCFADASCHRDDLVALGLDRYARCPRNATQSFTAADSRMVCGQGPSLVPAWSSDYRCDRLDFEGSLTFFCPPPPTSGNDSLVVRYEVLATPLTGGPYGMEGRMSLDVTSVARRESRGDRHRHVVPVAGGGARFVGYHWIGNIGATDGTATSDVWFLASEGAAELAGGGFHVDVDMSRLR